MFIIIKENNEPSKKNTFFTKTSLSYVVCMLHGNAS